MANPRHYGPCTNGADETQGVAVSAGEVADAAIFALLPKLAAVAKWAHIEKLQEFDGQPSFTKAQGED